MKKNVKAMIALLLVLSLLMTALSACGGTGGEEETAKNETVTEAGDEDGKEATVTEKETADEEDGEETSAKAEEENEENDTEPAASAEPLTFELSQETEGCYKVSFNVVPTTASQLTAVDITNEYVACTAIMLAFVLYETNPEEALEALTVLSGPNGVSDQDKSFIKNQYAQYPYVARSYFEGSSPANDYLLSENTIVIQENDYSRANAGYVSLLLTSGGADSARELQLRQKGSTGEWFMNSFMGILAGIREPESTDLWDGLAGSDLRTFNDTVTVKSGSGDEAVISVSSIPTQDDFEKIDLTDEYKTAAAVVYALSLYETDKEACYEALEYLNGPTDLSDYDKNFLKTQFEQYPYVARSYFEGAIPSNDYTPSSYAVTVSENVNSFAADNFVTIYVTSNGADNPRSMSLRLQRSTGMWFVTSFGGVLMGIQTPASDDPWN